MPRLTMRLFGPPRLELDGLELQFDRRKALALLAYLAVTRQSHSREALAALLWPEYEASRAYAYLRRVLWEIHQTVGEGWVLASREWVILNPQAEVWLDVAHFQQLLAECRKNTQECAVCRPRLTEAAALYRDHFLAGFSTRDAPNFDEWVFFQAEGLRRDLAIALETLVHCHGERGEAEAAVPLARRWLALDPLNEAAHRQLMLAYEQAGQHSAALRQYQECVRILQEELGAPPQPETTALYERIRTEEAAAMRPAPMRPRPTGTVTFLFTDIEGSTQLWEKHHEAMKAAFASHEVILRQAVAAHGGHAYKMVGDAFQVAFATAADALAAALEAQRNLQSPISNLQLRVRMALHAGVVEERDDDYIGPVLNRVARLVSVGHGGQVLLTQVTCDLVRDHLPPDADLRDLGDHRLRDLVRPERIYQLVAPGLPADFPPLQSLDTFAHNLPVQLTSFVGREKEIGEVKRLLLGTRFVTLTGPGGTGKTRLALHIAAELLELFPDGAWLVELVPLADPALVPQTVATALGLREAPGRPILTLLTDYLRAKNSLLILDNCEHLVEACAQLVDTLLRSCPQLFVLASSREALGITGEVPYRVPSLSTPDARRLPPVERLTQYEAVRLFVERAETVLPGFTLTNANAPVIAQLCYRLDGIPLAIELAAARAKLLRVEEIAARLDDRFRLLTGGSRTALPRHQTLRALIDWSYDLLSEAERVLFQRLSVFAGGWTLEAAEVVCGDNLTPGPTPERRVESAPPSLPGTVGDRAGGLGPVDVLDLLTQLVNKSLVLPDREQGAETRYRLLETIRQYAREKFLESGGGDAEAVRDRHLDYFLKLAEQAEPELRGPDQVEWLDRLEGEHDNLRAALEWSLEGRGAPAWSPEAALRIAAAPLWFWHIRGHKSEGVDWLERAVSAEASERGDEPLVPARALLRAKALQVAGSLALFGFQPARGAELSEESLALFRELGPAGRRGMAYALWNLGLATYQQEGFDRGSAPLQESLALFREAQDKFGIAQCLDTLGAGALNDNDYERARAIWEEDLALRKELGDRDGIANVLSSLGELAFSQGDHQRAGALFEESLAGFRQVGNKFMMGGMLSSLGYVAWAQGDYEQARRLFEEALALGREGNEKFGIAAVLSNLGDMARSQGDYEQAAKRYEEALALAREVGNKGAIAGTICGLGEVAWAQGDYEQAAKLFEEALGLGREMGGRFTIAVALHGLGKVARSRGDHASAHSLHEEVLAALRGTGDRWGIAYSLEALAALATARRDMERAARLFGAAETSHDRIRFLMSPAERTDHEHSLASTRTALGEEAYAAAWAEGRAMTLEQAVAYALEEDH